MSRTVIVGLAVLVVAALSFIVIGRLSEGDVAEMDPTPQVEVDEDALVVEEDEPAPTVASPEEDVTERALNDNSDPLEEQVESAEEADLERVAPVPNDSEASDGAAFAAGSDGADADAASDDAAVVVIDEDATDAEATEEVTATEVEIEPVEGADDSAGAVVESDEATEEEAATTEAAPAETETATGDATEDATEEAVVVDDAATSDGTPGDEASANDAGELIASEAELAALLTPETFDVDAILAYVDSADSLDPVEAEGLRTALEQARDEPEFVDAAILRIRRTFDIE